MRRRGTTGVWEIFIPRIGEGEHYKYELLGPDGTLLPQKADPFGFGSEHPPATASIVRGLDGFAWADADWLGEAGPGPSYLEPGSGGPENDFTNRNTTFMTWNLMHMARMLKDAGGIPAHGNQRSEWDAGCRFDHPNPMYR